MSTNQLRLPIALAALGVLTILFGSWDTWWHLMRKTETFWALPHVLGYATVFASAILAVGAVWRGVKRYGAPQDVPHIRPLALAAIGAALQAVALLLDMGIHLFNEFDVSLWTPPHLLLAFGGVLAMLGTGELFYSLTDGQGRGRWLYLVGYGLSIAYLQSALTEYDIANWWAWQARWKGFTMYYAVLLCPLLAYTVIASTKKLQQPTGTVLLSVPLLLKFVLFGAWSLTPIPLYVPLLLILAGILFDLFYQTYRHTSKMAIDIAILGLALGLVAAIVWQHPFDASLEDVLFALVTCVLIGMFTAWVVDSLDGSEEDEGEEEEEDWEHAT